MHLDTLARYKMGWLYLSGMGLLIIILFLFLQASLSYTWTSVEHIHLTTEKHCYQVMWLLKENTEQVFSVLIVMPSQQYAPYCLRSGAGVD